MRWTFRITAAFLLLLAAYTVWPFVDLYRLGVALQHGDVAAMSNYIEMRSLRPQLAKQVIATYLRIAGRDAKLPGFLGDAAVGLGASVADRALGEFVGHEQVGTLLQEALSTEQDDAPRRVAGLAPRNIGSLWRLYASADYKLHNFYVSVPPSFPPERRFRIHLRLSQWTWKLHGIDLPEPLRVRLAELMIRHMQKQKP